MNYDIELQTSGNLDILKERQGIYIFFGKNNEIYYVGLAVNLYKRIRTHLNKRDTGTFLYSHLFDTVKIIFHDDPETLGDLESEIINKLKPLVNRGKVYYTKSSMMLGTINTEICLASISLDGPRCTRKATYNGFCIFHDPLQSEIPHDLRGKYVTIEMLRLLNGCDFNIKGKRLYFRMSKKTFGRLMTEFTYADIQYKRNEAVLTFKRHFILIDDDDVIRLTRFG